MLETVDSSQYVKRKEEFADADKLQAMKLISHESRKFSIEEQRSESTPAKMNADAAAYDIIMQTAAQDKARGEFVEYVDRRPSTLASFQRMERATEKEFTSTNVADAVILQASLNASASSSEHVVGQLKVDRPQEDRNVLRTLKEENIAAESRSISATTESSATLEKAFDVRAEFISAGVTFEDKDNIRVSTTHKEFGDEKQVLDANWSTVVGEASAEKFFAEQVRPLCAESSTERNWKVSAQEIENLMKKLPVDEFTEKSVSEKQHAEIWQQFFELDEVQSTTGGTFTRLERTQQAATAEEKVALQRKLAISFETMPAQEETTVEQLQLEKERLRQLETEAKISERSADIIFSSVHAAIESNVSETVLSEVQKQPHTDFAVEIHPVREKCTDSRGFEINEENQEAAFKRTQASASCEYVALDRWRQRDESTFNEFGSVDAEAIGFFNRIALSKHDSEKVEVVKTLARVWHECFEADESKEEECNNDIHLTLDDKAALGSLLVKSANRAYAYLSTDASRIVISVDDTFKAHAVLSTEASKLNEVQTAGRLVMESLEQSVVFSVPVTQFTAGENRFGISEERCEKLVERAQAKSGAENVFKDIVHGDSVSRLLTESGEAEANTGVLLMRRAACRKSASASHVIDISATLTQHLDTQSAKEAFNDISLYFSLPTSETERVVTILATTEENADLSEEWSAREATMEAEHSLPELAFNTCERCFAIESDWLRITLEKFAQSDGALKLRKDARREVLSSKMRESGHEKLNAVINLCKVSNVCLLRNTSECVWADRLTISAEPIRLICEAAATDIQAGDEKTKMLIDIRGQQITYDAAGKVWPLPNHGERVGLETEEYCEDKCALFAQLNSRRDTFADCARFGGEYALITKASQEECRNMSLGLSRRSQVETLRARPTQKLRLLSSLCLHASTSESTSLEAAFSKVASPEETTAQKACQRTIEPISHFSLHTDYAEESIFNGEYSFRKDECFTKTSGVMQGRFCINTDASEEHEQNYSVREAEEEELTANAYYSKDSQQLISSRIVQLARDGVNSESSILLETKQSESEVNSVSEHLHRKEQKDDTSTLRRATNRGEPEATFNAMSTTEERIELSCSFSKQPSLTTVAQIRKTPNTEAIRCSVVESMQLESIEETQSKVAVLADKRFGGSIVLSTDFAQECECSMMGSLFASPSEVTAFASITLSLVNTTEHPLLSTAYSSEHTASCSFQLTKTSQSTCMHLLPQKKQQLQLPNCKSRRVQMRREEFGEDVEVALNEGRFGGRIQLQTSHAEECSASVIEKLAKEQVTAEVSAIMRAVNEAQPTVESCRASEEVEVLAAFQLECGKAKTA
uniref:VWFA domain-containing protein n=1 Tax=Parascaris equorum TaxID=6256 RepID=A0A914S0T9_PAREQ